MKWLALDPNRQNGCLMAI